MTVPTIVDTTETKEPSNTTSHTATLSGTETIGNLLLAFIGVSADGNTEEITESGTSDWTKDGEAYDVTSDAHLAIFWLKVDGTEDASYEFSSITTIKSVNYVIEVSGQDPTSPINASDYNFQGGDSTTQNITGVTTDINDCLIFAGLNAEGGDLYPFGESGAGWSLHIDGQQGTTSGGAATWIGKKELASFGATGTVTVTTNVSGSTAFAQIAIAPASSDTAPLVLYTSPGLSVTNP